MNVRHLTPSAAAPLVDQGDINGEHFVHFYQDDETLLAALRPFVELALNGKGAAVVVATRAHLDQLNAALETRGFDLDAAHAEGRYVTQPAEEMLPALLVDGWPQTDLFASVIEPLVAAATAKHGQAYVFGELVALLWNENRHGAVIRLEELWNELRRRYYFSLFCAYPMNRVHDGPLELVRQVCREHGSTTPPDVGTSPPEDAPAAREIRDLRRTVQRLEAELRERRTMEGKLAQREHALQDFLDNATVPMHSVGPDGRILWANKAELDLLGYQENEYVGHPIAGFHADGEIISNVLERLLAGETVRNQPAQLRCKDGSIKQVLIHSSAFWDNDRFLHTRCVTLDITTRKLLEESERKRDDVTREAGRTSALLAAIVESSDDAIVSKTLDGIITTWNAGAVRLYGYTPEEAIGQAVTLIIPPELHEEERQILDKLRRGERVDHFETVRVTKDGRRVEISLTVSPVRDAEGNIIGASKVSRDVTEQRRARLELHRLRDELAEELAGMRRLHEISTRLVRQQEHLETLLEEVLQAALEIAGDELGCLQLCDETTGQLKTSVMHGLSEAFCALFDTVLERTGLACGDHERMIGDDDAGNLEAVAGMPAEMLQAVGARSVLSTSLTTRSGHRIGRLTVFGRKPSPPSDRELRQLDLLARLATDAIERTRAETRLKEEDQRKNEFLAILAHELRNPLAPIRYAVSITRHPNLKPEQRMRAEEVIGRQVEHMARLLDDLLDVSRITRGMLELRKQPLELGAAVTAAIETAKPLIDAKHHALTVELPPKPVRLEADPVRLAQIFSNLLNNAAKYTDPGGHVRLKANVDGGEVVVRVRDNGIGMAPDMIPRLFNMFVQAGPALDRSEGGLGIGLALVRGLAALHGGTVEAFSDGPGRGSEFIVRLPLEQPEAASEQGGKAAENVDAPPLKVLIADDNRDIADTCCVLIELLGHEAHVAYSGEQAFELAQRLRPDMLLLDIGMPDLSGYELARRLRGEAWTARATLVAATGWGQDADKQRSYEAGFDAHLTKPIDQDALEQLFQRCRRDAARD